MDFDFCDAHFHLVPFLEISGGLSSENFLENSFSASDEIVSEKMCAAAFEDSAKFFPPKENHFFCTCAHSKEEFSRQEEFLSSDFFCREKTVRAFGLHPQNPILENADFLERLLKERKIEAVGEAGFDFFSEELKENAAAQEEAWNVQLQLAQEYGATLVVHARRAMQKIFEYAPKLKNLRSVVFHSFAASAADASSILRRGVNAYFSFGKPILNGAKKARSCVKSLPTENLLFETDAPFQTLRWEAATPPSDIARVYQCAFELRRLASRRALSGEEGFSFGEFCENVRRNFSSAFGISR